MLSLVNNYFGEHTNGTLKGAKRRKTGPYQEVVIKSENDTKIILNSYALENYDDAQHKSMGYEQNDIQQFENEMNANSELDDVNEEPERFVLSKEITAGNYNHYYEPAGLHHQAESIEDFMNNSHKMDDFKEFGILANESSHLELNVNLESNVNLMSNNQDWKVDSNFQEPKSMRTIDRIKMDTHEEATLLKVPGPSVSLIDRF